MYLGRFQLGDRMAIPLLTTDADYAPDLPAAAPVLKLYGPSGATVVVEYKMPPVDKVNYPGLFMIPVHLGPLFSVGQWEAVMWYDSAQQTANFDIIAGGNSDGHVIALHWYQRPHADFLVQQLDSRKIVKGRNPTVIP